MITIDQLQKGQRVQIEREHKTGYEVSAEFETAEIRKVYRKRGQIYVWTDFGYGYNLTVDKHQQAGGKLTLI